MKHHKLFWGSSYDRELDVLLYIWPNIKEKFPDAELHICYGWDLFDKIQSNNPERMQWKATVSKMMQQEGIIHHGRVGKKELAKIRAACGIWAYPTAFHEIFCITAVDAQASGLVPVTMDIAALPETVKAGVLVKGDIDKQEVVEKYLKELLDLMGDKKRWKQESIKAKKAAKEYRWENIASKWIDVFNEPISTPEVSVITITIREGWWNVMADNLSKQTYPISEWIIVDDYPEDRSGIAREIAEKYNLSISYYRGVKGDEKYGRRYGILGANNIGWKKARGELLVYLQDFIIIPERGIESLVDVYRHHPNALIAPVDTYYHCKEPNQKNKVDWWDGETDIIGKVDWVNVRCENKGVRETDMSEEFEMNYGAIPKKVVEELNGWWEFFGNMFGFDNNQIAFRHLQNGGEIIIDDTNKAQCINLWPWIGGTEQNVVERDRHPALPIYYWFKRRTEDGRLPIVRDEKIDKSIQIDFTVPDEISDEYVHGWTKAHYKEIERNL